MKTYSVQNTAGKAWFQTHDLEESRAIKNDLRPYHRDSLSIVDENGTVIDDTFVETVQADPTRRLRALNLLFDHDICARLSDLYDSNAALRAAVSDLIGPTFEYPDWSDLTLMKVIKRGACIKAESPDWLSEMVERRVSAGHDEVESRTTLLGLIFGNDGTTGDWSGWLVQQGFADLQQARAVVKLIVSTNVDALTSCHSS